MDLTKTDPNDLKQAEAARIKEILPKLAGMKKIIAVTEARAKELLTEDPDIFDGDWILKEGAKDRRIVDQAKFVEAMMGLADPHGDYPIGADKLLEIATFPVGKAEKLIQEAFAWPKKLAAEKINDFGEEIVAIGQKAPTLKEVIK